MKVSYNTKVWSDTGTVYKQRITMTEREFDAICDAIRCEQAMGFPQKEKYSNECDTVLRVYFKAPHIEKFKQPYLKKALNVSFLTLTQARYLRKYAEIKDRLKTERYNTYIQIIGGN